MRHLIKKLLSVAVALTLTGLSLPAPARAQTYPIDCAILLCLSGGWPASVPCARARAEFIRRITPWPVEPPLQIWRCPMGVSYEPVPRSNSADRIYEAFFKANSAKLRKSFPVRGIADISEPIKAPWRSPDTNKSHFPSGLALHLVQDRADIDISGPEFNFVRSIRVFHIRNASQYQAGSEGNCVRSAQLLLGTYGPQGGYTWRRTSMDALPHTHLGLEAWGSGCQRIHHRSVFVDWRDFEGTYGFEQINY